jgi:hypothetical protein
LLFAVTGKTAAELVRQRIDPGSTTFGLTTWRGGQPVKADATVAKNYLSQTEISDLDLRAWWLLLPRPIGGSEDPSVWDDEHRG